MTCKHCHGVRDGRPWMSTCLWYWYVYFGNLPKDEPVTASDLAHVLEGIISEIEKGKQQ
jgi:hypothetical protein